MSATTNRLFNASIPVYAACFVLSLIMLWGGIGHLLTSAADMEMVLPIGLAWTGAHFKLDALAAFFLVIVNLGVAAASFYALGYGRHEEAPHRVLPFYPAFIAAMNLVVLAGDAFTFLFAWEFMSLTSWALVMAHHREKENLHAGYVYIVMASFGTFMLLLAFALLAGPHGHYVFSEMRHNPVLSWRAALVLFLALLGAGSKAGIYPLHVWLPLAHPAAPSHVSGLMSGVMTKVAVYGFIRIVFGLLGGSGENGGMAVLTLGGITAVMGVLYALMQHDLKKLLAFSTVENIGIIFIGLGLALVFKTNGQDAFAALAFTAALFHVFNHSLFKSLLFFGAGAVQTAAQTRDMERLGGLIHRMPQTAFVFLVGCAAISALLPFNGFASEWLTFQAIIQGPVPSHWGLKMLVPASGAMLALAAALAAACFVKVYGIVFLGRPRTEKAKNAVETDRFSLTAMFMLALLCLLAGIFPGFVINVLTPTVREMTGAHMPHHAEGLTLVPVSAVRSSYNGLFVFAFMVFSAGLVALLARRLGGGTPRRAPAWDCGFPLEDPQTQYTAESFAQPIRRVFGRSLFRASERVEMPPPGSSAPARLVQESHDAAWEGIYDRISSRVFCVAERMDRFQFLSIRHYLGIVFLSLILLLGVLALWF